MQSTNRIMVLGAIVLGFSSSHLSADAYPIGDESELYNWPAYEGIHQVWRVDDDTKRPWFLRSPLANMTWPKVELPRFEFTTTVHELERPRLFLGQDEPGMLETIMSTPQRIAGHTKSLWNNTIDLFKFGRNDAPQIQAQRDPRRKPQWLARLFGGGEPEQEGPRTINEWMEQDRIQP